MGKETGQNRWKIINGPGLEAAMFFLLTFHLLGCGHLETPDHRGGWDVQSSCAPTSHPISAYRFGHLRSDCGMSVSECLRFHLVDGTKEVALALTLELLWKKEGFQSTRHSVSPVFL